MDESLMAVLSEELAAEAQSLRGDVEERQRRNLQVGPWSMMQIFRFSANFSDFVTKNVILVNRLNPLRQFGVW